MEIIRYLCVYVRSVMVVVVVVMMHECGVMVTGSDRGGEVVVAMVVIVHGYGVSWGRGWCTFEGARYACAWWWC